METSEGPRGNLKETSNMLKVIIKMKNSQTREFSNIIQSDFDSRMRLYGRSSSFCKLYLYKKQSIFQNYIELSHLNGI